MFRGMQLSCKLCCTVRGPPRRHIRTPTRFAPQLAHDVMFLYSFFVAPWITSGGICINIHVQREYWNDFPNCCLERSDIRARPFEGLPELPEFVASAREKEYEQPDQVEIFTNRSPTDVGSLSKVPYGGCIYPHSAYDAEFRCTPLLLPSPCGVFFCSLIPHQISSLPFHCVLLQSNLLSHYFIKKQHEHRTYALLGLYPGQLHE